MQQINIDSEFINSRGTIQFKTDFDDGTFSTSLVKNKILLGGRRSLAKTIGNLTGGNFQFYIARMLFGVNGTLNGSVKKVEENRTSLFGPIALAKPVIVSYDEDRPDQVIYTSVINKSELINQTINEIALEMANGELFSMATFGNVTKTGQMAITWNYKIVYL